MIRFQSLCKSLPISWFQNNYVSAAQISTALFPLQFQISPTLWSEPMRRKKRIDPMIMKHREERKIKKLEKRIRQLKKFSRILKPIEENKVPKVLFDELEKRKRPPVEIPKEVAEERIRLLKEWTKFKLSDYIQSKTTLTRLQYSQEKALQELRKESEELYQAAVKIDSNFLPFQFTGPNETPPIENYNPPDGDYTRTRKSWK